MSDTTMSSHAECLGEESPAKATRCRATALRRATRSVQYFPYTDLTTPSQVQKKSACGQVSPYPDGSAISVWRRQPVPERARLSRPRSAHAYPSAVFAIGLLPRRGAQAVPGVADLVVMDLGRIVRSIEGERLDIEPADGAEQRIGGDHAVSLGADQPRAGGREVLLRVEHIERRALARLRFLLHAGERDAGSAHLRLRGGERNFRPLESDPGAQNRGLGLTADELQHDAGLHRTLLGLPDLRGR